jgi:hypothetical protein
METKLDLILIPTYNPKTLGIADSSVYADDLVIQSPTIEITIPGLGLVSIPFVPSDFNVFNSGILEITEPTEDSVNLPDGVWTITYSIYPSHLYSVTKNILRVDQLQEKFDQAFMKLDMMECDGVIKKQAKVELNTIWFLIQGAIAAANNCAVNAANKLYIQASKQLDTFIKNNCGCSGTNYL